ncbi:MAG: HAMP domain-containing sensor histidine kinase [Planctomycetota bacterium]
MFRWLGRLSISHKLPLLVGLAVTVITVIALTPSWLRMRSLVDAGQMETSRALLLAWAAQPAGEDGRRPEVIGDARVRIAPLAVIEREAAAGDDVAGEVVRRLVPPSGGELDLNPVMISRSEGFARRTVYARIDPQAGWQEEGRAGVEGAGGSAGVGDAGERSDEGSAGPAVILLSRTSENAGALIAVSTMYVFAAGSVVLAVALVSFYLITYRLVLRPVRSLRLWADAVRDGNLDERSVVQTGDEFERLAETFNGMLDGLQTQQRQLRAVNASLDVKLNELAEANDTLDRAGRLKGEFIATMSHEFRTPLNAIIGFGELLAEFVQQDASRETDVKQRARLEKRGRYLNNIVEAAQGLLGLIDSMMEMARIEAGRVAVNPRRVDAVELCRGAGAMVQPQADREGVRLVIEPASEAITLHTDATKLQQVLLNLLSNAVKFASPRPAGEAGRGRERGGGLDAGGGAGAPGLVELTVEAVDGGIRIDVRDDGPGIAPEDQERIFRTFERLETGITREHGGAGLGLAISKELCDLLQGEIRLASEVGVGSTFTVILPARFDPDRAAEQQLESRFRGMLSRLPVT